MRSAVLTWVGAALMGASVVPAQGAQQIKPAATQIAEAVFALPPADRNGATVLGYRDTVLVVLREGRNDFICLADRPGSARYQSSCYHRSLEPFMTRGRELRSEGKSRRETRRIRKEEIENGTLPMPSAASMVTLYGRINEDTGRPDSVAVLRVVYLPYATSETTGFPTRDQVPRGEPYLMDPGEHRAHLMIPSGTKAFDLRPGRPRRRRGHKSAVELAPDNRL